jgi:superfamily II DNA or RNA helicase
MYKELQTLEGKEVYFIQGSVEVEDRRKIQQLMEKQDNVVCVAISKIFSTGISIKNIHYIMFAAGGKSKIKTLQSIGRGLRIHENKEILTIIDLVDNLVYGKKHFDKRKQFYDLEKIQIKHKTITES